MEVKSVDELCAGRGCGNDVETDDIAIGFESCRGGGNLAEKGVRG